jgi:hypothetical protein
LHPLESAAFARRTPGADIEAEVRMSPSEHCAAPDGDPLIKAHSHQTGPAVDVDRLAVHETVAHQKDHRVAGLLRGAKPM